MTDAKKFHLLDKLSGLAALHNNRSLALNPPNANSPPLFMCNSGTLVAIWVSLQLAFASITLCRVIPGAAANW